MTSAFPCDDDPGSPSERAILLAYVAAEYRSLTAALNALADQNALTRRHAYSAQEQSDVASWAWAMEVGDFSDLNPEDRMIEVRKFLTDHIAGLEAMRERLSL